MLKFRVKALAILTVVLCHAVTVISASPIDYLLFGDEDDETADAANDYDLRYDQRQNGTANVRLRLDGIVIAAPSSKTNQLAASAGDTALDYLFDLVPLIALGDQDNVDVDSDEYKPDELDNDAFFNDDKEEFPLNGDKEEEKPVLSSTEKIPSTTEAKKEDKIEADNHLPLNRAAGHPKRSNKNRRKNK